ncbi:MAG: hypothetical protein LH702_36750 [Phormidesmis sp. CAN_BIN44]|nr:hypothetical protein [Phormidesmis sp. CAN_BIN44]
METTYESMGASVMGGYSPKNRQEAEQLERQLKMKVIPTRFAVSIASQHYCPNLNNQASQ